MKRHWNAALQSLILIRFGQELGTDSQAARAIAAAIDLVVSALSRVCS